MIESYVEMYKEMIPQLKLDGLEYQKKCFENQIRQAGPNETACHILYMLKARIELLTIPSKGDKLNLPDSLLEIYNISKNEVTVDNVVVDKNLPVEHCNRVMLDICESELPIPFSRIRSHQKIFDLKQKMKQEIGE
jgi:hypothetical protein